MACVTNATVFGGENTLSVALALAVADIKSVTRALSLMEGIDASSSLPTPPLRAKRPRATRSPSPQARRLPRCPAGGELAGIRNSPIPLLGKNCVQPEVAGQVRRSAPKHIVLLEPKSLDDTLENRYLCG